MEPKLITPAEKIPAEGRWAIGSRGLSGMWTATLRSLADAVGEEKAREFSKQMWVQAGAGIKEFRDAFGMTGDDAHAAREAIMTLAGCSLGPELQVEVVEVTPKRSVLRVHQCTVWNRSKEMGWAMDCAAAGCIGFNEAACKVINPKLVFSRTKAMPWGDPYCEDVTELPT